MNLSRKITLVTIASIIATAVGALVTVRWLSARNRVSALQHEMSAVLSQAEMVAESMGAMHRNGSFDVNGMLASARRISGGRTLKETYRSTSFYQTIPIVAAWQAAESSAQKLGYEFPRHPRRAWRREIRKTTMERRSRTRLKRLPEEKRNSFARTHGPSVSFSRGPSESPQAALAVTGILRGARRETVWMCWDSRWKA